MAIKIVSTPQWEPITLTCRKCRAELQVVSGDDVKIGRFAFFEHDTPEVAFYVTCPRCNGDVTFPEDYFDEIRKICIDLYNNFVS